MSDFKLGDVVQLKSGGPKMTIDRISVSQASCTWFEGTKLEGGWFEMAILISAGAGPSSSAEKEKRIGY
jgi:uncharacterized protein YodC (DUF2158 family)